MGKGGRSRRRTSFTFHRDFKWFIISVYDRLIYGDHPRKVAISASGSGMRMLMNYGLMGLAATPYGPASVG